jgi:hypothetical protein
VIEVSVAGIIYSTTEYIIILLSTDDAHAIEVVGGY